MYLDERGYQAVKISETTTKTPDLEVSGHGNSYLNEFKSPDLLLDQVLGLYKFATTNSKLLQRRAALARWRPAAGLARYVACTRSARPSAGTGSCPC